MAKTRSALSDADEVDARDPWVGDKGAQHLDGVDGAAGAGDGKRDVVRGRSGLWMALR